MHNHSLRTSISVVLVGAVALAMTGIATIAPVAWASSVTVAVAPVHVWPEFHADAQVTGANGDSTISTANASTLGVRRMTAIGSSLDSPAVVWNTSLGATIAYAGGTGGFFNAVNVATGQIVWSDYLGAAITASPLVENGTVWIAPAGTGKLYKLNGADGSTECTGTVPNAVLSSPVFATPPGGVPTIYVGSLGSGPKDGPVTAYSEHDCTQLWQFDSFVQPGLNTGVWAPLSYAVDEMGRGLLLFGSANPDSTVYALNASTGAVVWRYSTYCPPTEDWDVGAGVTSSAPGTNGFADGMAYVEGKDGILFALDLTTGSVVWQFNFAGNSSTNPVATNTDALSTPALSGTTLVFGDIDGLYAVDAVTGHQEWFTATSGDVNASPAIVGPPGKLIAAYGDLDGNFTIVQLSNGRVLYNYKTGDVITSSPADVDGNLLVDSEDGFLYDFHVGGGNGLSPTTSITAPAGGAVLANPNGSLHLRGSASASDGVKAVKVQVQESGAAGPWLHQAGASFLTGISTASATLAAPDSVSTTWTLAVPVSAAGGAFRVYASAVGANAVADTTAYSGVSSAASSSFSVEPSGTAPAVQVNPSRVAPQTTAELSASGFAAGESVTFTVPLTTGPVATLATVSADSQGEVAATAVTLPPAVAFGPDPISATGAVSGLVGSGTVIVSNDDVQLGYGSGHTGAEDDDSVIQHYQAVSTANKLVQNWSLTGSAGFHSTPAFSAGIAYVGNQLGVLYAVNMTSGATVFTVPLGASTSSSPAVADGTVFIGNDAGRLGAFDALTGAPVWSAAIGGHLNSVAVANGLVYVTSSNGSTAAVDESSGVIVWNVKAGGTVNTVPAVDPVTGGVAVTNHAGRVEMLSGSDGATLWSTQLNGVPTAPMISSGRVFVGSSNSSVTALSVSLGATVWSASCGSAITAAPILAYSHVAVGTSAGAVSYFDPLSGALISTQAFFGHPITGLTSTAGLLLLASPWGMGMIEGPKYVRMTWLFANTSGYATPGVFLNGDMFVAGSDGVLRGFTIPGRAMA